jgi:hypothetical protein
MLKQIDATGDPLVDLNNVANWLYQPHNRERFERVWMFIIAWINDWERVG